MKPAFCGRAFWLGGLLLAAMAGGAYAREAGGMASGLAGVVGEPAGARSELPVNIPLRRDEDSASGLGGQGALAVWGLLVIGGVIGLIVYRQRGRSHSRPFGAWGRWFGATPGGKPAAPAVLGQVRLGPAHSLHAVEWRGSHYLLACSQHGTQLIAHHPAVPDPVSSSPPQVSP